MPTPTIQHQTRTNKRFLEPLGGSIPLEMVLIRGGEFLIGSPDDELERASDGREDPQHQVTVPTFFMGRYSVTQAQWRVVARLPRIQRDLEADPSHFKGDNRPVEQVSWYNAVEFCDRLSVHTKRQYRLPSEAEWEYACRAGTTSPFYCGETITTEIANYKGSSTYGRGIKGEDRRKTTPVDQFNLANPWGLCDMHGNVWEWCLDHWHENYDGAPTDGSAWLSENENTSRVYRGGSWSSNPRNCRSVCRNHYHPAYGDLNIGFRVVVAPPGTP
jgi:formylglycine-generating enzyme required for sulfatase activity